MYTIILAIALAGSPIPKENFCLVSMKKLQVFKTSEDVHTEYLDYENGCKIAKLLQKRLYVGTNLKPVEHRLAAGQARSEGAIYCICDKGLFDKGVTKLFFNPEKNDLYIESKPVESKIKETTEEMSCSSGSCGVQSSNKFFSGFSGSCSSCR